MPKLYRLVREKNRALNRWEQYYGKDELKSFPLHIQFPTGTTCNLKCLFCTERNGTKAKKYDYKNLSFEQFSSILKYDGWRHALSCAYKIELYGWGEPLCNPDYEKIFDYVAANFPGIGIVISTNGTMFSQKWSEKIISVEMSEVNFSVNSASKKTYHRLMGTDLFERVTSNIRYLTDLRNKYKTRNPYITLSYVATLENIRELPEFVDLAVDYGADCIIVQDTMIFNENTEKLSLTNDPVLAYKMCESAVKKAKEQKIMITFISFETHKGNYFPPNPEYNDDRNILIAQDIQGEHEEIPQPFFTDSDCFDPWERFMIRADGEVFPCCQSQTFREFTLGSIYEQNFLDIWNGDAYRYFRKMINTSNPPQVCAVCPRKERLNKRRLNL